MTPSVDLAIDTRFPTPVEEYTDSRDQEDGDKLMRRSRMTWFDLNAS